MEDAEAWSYSQRSRPVLPLRTGLPLPRSTRVRAARCGPPVPSSARWVISPRRRRMICQRDDDLVRAVMRVLEHQDGLDGPPCRLPVPLPRPRPGRPNRCGARFRPRLRGLGPPWLIGTGDDGNGCGLPGLEHPLLDRGGQPAGFSSAGFEPEGAGVLLHHYLSLTRCPGYHRRLLGSAVMVGDREVRGSRPHPGIG